MPTDALTSTGLQIDSLADRTAEIKAAVRASVDSALELGPKDPLGCPLEVVAERVQSGLELVQSAYSAIDPDQATGQSLDAVSSMSGIYRDEATFGTVSLTVNLNAVTTLPAGKIAAVAGDPDNQWKTTAAVTSVGAGNYAVAAQATVAGSIAAGIGTITTIVTPVTGWNTVTNAAAATEGDDSETDTDFRVRRELELALGGSTSVDAIVADMLDPDGAALDQARCYENDRWYSYDGMPPKSIELVWWDGGASPSDARLEEISEYLWAAKAGGIQAYGTTKLLAGTAITITDSQGRSHTAEHTRAAQVVLEVAYTLATDDDYEGDVAFKAAVVAAFTADQEIGDDILIAKLVYFGMVQPGVTNVSFLQIWVDGAGPFVTSQVVGDREIATLDAADVTVI